MLVTGLLGWAFERILIAPVYGQPLKQILITMGGMIVAEQLIAVIWGAEHIAMPLPASLRGSIVLGDAAIAKYRLVAVAVGLVVFALMFLVLNRTRLGLLIRAGVENREMVEAMGYRIGRLFVMVFAAGSALAGLGGVLWGFYNEVLTATSRYFSIAASPSTMAPRRAVGSGRAICSAPQITLISCSATIMPPMVIRICLRCWP